MKNNLTITLKFKKLPNNCTECPLYQSNSYEDDEPMFGDGIHNYCPYGGSTYGCVVERPKDCPIGKTIILMNEEERIEDQFNHTKFNYKVKLDLLKDYLDINNTTFNQVVKLVNNPVCYKDLQHIAFLCGYKPGWAYYEAKKLNLYSEAVYDDLSEESDIWMSELTSDYYAGLNGGG